MTFCLGMRTREGLVGISDTRVTSGNEMITAGKVAVFHNDGGCFFLMTSGLRSVRDKVLTYFRDQIKSREKPVERLFQAVNLLADQIRQVAAEDKQALVEGGFQFDMHCLVGGQMNQDEEHSLYLVYPQGNWVEVGKGTPYQIIGVPGYGKPVLDRTLHFNDPLFFALKVGYLAFDSTRISAADVDFPLDAVVYRKDSFQIVEHRFQKEEVAHISEWWDRRLRDNIKELPSEWIEEVIEKLKSRDGDDNNVT